MNKRGSLLVIVGILAVLSLIVGSSWMFLSSYNFFSGSNKSVNNSFLSNSTVETELETINNSSVKNGKDFSGNNLINCSNVSIDNTSLCKNGTGNLVIDSCRLITTFEKYSFDEEVISSGGTISIKVWVFENDAKRIVYSESELGESISQNWAVSDEGILSNYMVVGGRCILQRGNVDPEYGHPETEYGNNDLESMALMREGISMDLYITDKKTIFGGHDVFEMNATKIEYADKAGVMFGKDAKFSFNYFSTEYCVPLQMEIFDGNYIKKTFSNIKVDNVDDSKFVLPTDCMDVSSLAGMVQN